MSVDVRDTEFESADGLRLSGTFVAPSDASASVAVLVHGSDTDRDAGGFFTRLAASLAEARIMSLRFDLRGHGNSGGQRGALTVNRTLDDIRSAVAHVRDVVGSGPVYLIGAGYAGGISAYYAAQHPDIVRKLVLLYPQLSYKERLVDDKPSWHIDRTSEMSRGQSARDPRFAGGRPFLNEPHNLLSPAAMQGSVPMLIVHGTGDTVIPVEGSRTFVENAAAPIRLLEIEGAQHEFAVDGDTAFTEHQTQEWQAQAISDIANWLSTAEPTNAGSRS